MRVALVTDAWHPQTNGVVTTLSTVVRYIRRLGHDVLVIEPGRFATLPLPSYAEIRVAATPWRVGDLLLQFDPDAVHVATEGPLGVSARAFLARRRIPFTTSLHTKFPEYIYDRTGLSPRVGYRYIRWFHSLATRTLVTTPTHRSELEEWGLVNLVVWGRGVDTERFFPNEVRGPRSRPRLTYVGRVAVEKNIEAFLRLDIDADKIVVGDGPARAELERRYPDAEWLGYRRGESLRHEYAEADVFVFPSKTDTFGLVMLEAMACGTPVAAYPATGPIDVIECGKNGWIDENLATSIERAREIPRESCVEFARQNNWAAVAGRLVENLEPVRTGVMHDRAA